MKFIMQLQRTHNANTNCEVQAQFICAHLRHSLVLLSQYRFFAILYFYSCIISEISIFICQLRCYRGKKVHCSSISCYERIRIEHMLLWLFASTLKNWTFKATLNAFELKTKYQLHKNLPFFNPFNALFRRKSQITIWILLLFIASFKRKMKWGKLENK